MKVIKEGEGGGVMEEDSNVEDEQEAHTAHWVRPATYDFTLSAPPPFSSLHSVVKTL